MNKKALGIVVVASIVAVAGIVYFGYQRGLFSGVNIGGIGGVREDSMMGAMGKQGQKVPSKSEFIDECKKSDKDEQDTCYGVGAFYYRDASFCKYINDSETKSQCTQENIEKMYSSGGTTLGGGMIPGGGATPFLPGGGAIPSGGIIPDEGTVPEGGVVPDSGGSTQPETKTEPPKLGEKVTDEACIDVMAYTNYSGYLILTEHNLLAAVPIGEKLDALEEKYGITEENVMDVCGATFDGPDFMDKVLKRMRELGYTGE